MVWFNVGKLRILNPSSTSFEAPLLLTSDIVRVALMATTYTINIDSDLLFGTTGVSTNEVSTVTGYTARGDGRALASKAFAQDDTNDRAEFDAADLVYSSLGGTSDQTFNQILILRAPDASESNNSCDLIAHAAVSSTTTNGGNITLVWNAEGILQIT